ncbi:hypothetical protein A6E15_16770 [Natrinema saccharevitans]|uniref:VWFA domain-containing protein n=2 Tax=Natrinema saccharevitans TaxID=301967 RepID=A0A1S8B0P9_9EURY|nr:hypothetical protein A6E15_16770 [Natrinema saccharevitans]
MTFFSEQGPEYRLDDITQGTDGAVYAGLYFDGRESGTRLTRIHDANNSVETAWETDISPTIHDLKQGPDGTVFVATSTGIRGVNPADGTRLWSTSIPGGTTELAIAGDDRLYAIEQGDDVTAPRLLTVNSTDGAIVNSTALPVDDEAVVVGIETAVDGSIYIGTHGTESRIIRGDESSIETTGSRTVASSDQDGGDTVNAYSETTSSYTGFTTDGITSETKSPTLLKSGAITEFDRTDLINPVDAGAASDTRLYSTVTSSTQSESFSISAQDETITTDDALTLRFSADPSRTATLRLETSTGQEVYSTKVEATDAQKQFQLSIPQAGEYVAILESTSDSKTDSTDPITVSQPNGDAEPAEISIETSSMDLTTDDDLSLSFYADQQVNATLSLKTTDGQEVYSTAVEATTTEKTLLLSLSQPGEYLATIESESGGLTDTTEPVTVSSPDGNDGTPISIHALETNITTAENLVVDYRADETRNATLTVESTGGQTLLETAVTARQQSQQLSIPDLSAGEYVVRIVSDSGLEDSTDTVVVEESGSDDNGSASDPEFAVTARPNEFTTDEPLAVQIDPDRSRNVTLAVDSTTGQTVYETSLSLSDGPTTFRLNDVPAGEYTVTVGAVDSDIQATTEPITVKSLQAGIKFTEPVAGEPISFTSFVNNVGQNDTIVEADWNFGDGTTTSSTGQVKHVYEEPGKYTIELTLVDEFGNGTKRTATGTIFVRNETDNAAGAGTVTEISPNGSVDWQQTTETAVTDITAQSGIRPDRTLHGVTTPLWSVSVPESNSTYIEAAIRSNRTDENATLVARASNGSTRTTSTDRDTWTTVRVPVTEFAGDEITVTGRSSGDAPAEIRDVRVLTDDDEDGLPDYLEEQQFKLPFAAAASVSLDPETADTDGDGLADGREIRFFPANGSALDDQMRPSLAAGNPSVSDTDGDGLNDSVEAQYSFLNPFVTDSSGNGVSDPAADRDGDGLSNEEEISLGTNPRYSDTDGDGLTDLEEVREYDTDPRSADTDDDGLSDSEEFELETDPLDPDTNANGVVDGNETYTTSTSNESVGVDLDLTGQGNIAAGTTIEAEQNDAITGERVTNVSASEIVHLDSEQKFEDATVTIEYDDATDSDEPLTMVTYNESKQMYVPLNSTVDRKNNTVTASTPHFSTFSVFNIEKATSTWDARPPESYSDRSDSRSVDTVFVIDESGSMSGSPTSYAKEAVSRFIMSLDDDEQTGVVGFDSSSRVIQPLTTNHQRVNESLDGLTAGGGTNVTVGLREALDELERNSNSSHPQELILLSDGQTSGNPLEVADAAASQGIEINTVGLGSSVDEEELRSVANTTGGGFFHVENASDLPETFERIENKPRDSDGDGLPDKLEQESILLGVNPQVGGGFENSNRVKTDPHIADTDGDGLTDGQEVGEYSEVTHTYSGVGLTRSKVTFSYYKLRSDPTDPDTDNDQVNDHDERRIWDSDPTQADTDDDGLIDVVDPAVNEKTTPPRFKYQSYNINDLSQLPTTVRNPSERLAVVARPTGGATDIEEIHVHQYIDTWVPLVENGWHNQTFTGDDLKHAENSDKVYVTTTFGVLGRVSPEEVEITVVDDDGNIAGTSHDVDDGTVDVAAGVSATDTTTAGLAVGAVSSSEYAAVTTATGISVSSAAVIASGAVVAGGYAVWAETTGSAAGEVSQRAYAQSIPVTEPLWQEEIDGLEITLPSGAVYEHEIHDGHERKHGWEQIKELPGISQPGDVREIVRAPNAIEEDGRYDLIIGDNPGGDGQIILRVAEGLIIAADQIVEDPQGVEDEFLIPTDKSHIEDREEPHITQNSEIQRIVEEADEVYTNGYGLYVWVLYEEGTAKIVHGYDHKQIDETDHDRIVLSTAYERINAVSEFIKRLVESKQLNKIYPND